jgi:glycosyltransferase involved in cell wall biosynthesis
MRHEHLIVAIPARDEVASIGECIRSVDQAAAEVPVPVLVVVAADTCTDGTFEVASHTSTEFCTLAVIDGRWGRAGAARAAAVQHAQNQLSTYRGPVWIANTDADCLVPRLWLRIQLEMATDHDAIAGIVDLDPVSAAPAVFEAFSSTYLLDGDRHGHVHGANIGMCASAYEAVGGWCSQTVVGEDHVMWHALRGVGHRISQTTKLRVLTSARTRSRVLGGFATNLDKLDSQPEALLAAHV